jgi:thiol-disulfide isomerase/thioredoxin
MKKLSVIAISATLLLTGCGSGGLSKASENSFVSGNGAAVVIDAKDRQVAPAISGKTLDGSTFTLDASKFTVINVWASWCAPCRAEAPIFQQLVPLLSDLQFHFHL